MPHLSAAGLFVFQAVAGATQTAAHAAARHHGFWSSIGHWFGHASKALETFLKRFGIWGLAAIAFIDSALIPIPVQIALVDYVAGDRARFVLYAFVAALGASLGTIVPYYAGRLGGELFLLKRINRERYERLRDRFERQEFLAIMIPALGPPGTPIKLFELAAGVFEVKPLTFLLAMFTGKFCQFLLVAFVTYHYGPSAVHVLMMHVHAHTRLLLTLLGLVALAVVVWVVRRIFDRRRGTTLPIEEADTPSRAVASSALDRKQ